MMADFWKTKTFSELSKEWSKKLFDSGFIDAEEEINGQWHLKQYSRCIEDKLKYEYYSLITECLEGDTEIQGRYKTIMSMYAQGKKHNEIIHEVKKGGEKCNRWLIQMVISKYLKKWKVPHNPRKNWEDSK
jgi:hypothetical protein